MKHVLLTLILVLIVSCSNNISAPEGTTENDKPVSKNVTLVSLDNYILASKIHNEGLNFVYTGLNTLLNSKQSNTKSLFTQEELIEQSNQMIIDFMHQKLNEFNIELTTEENEEAVNLVTWAINNDWSDVNITINSIQENVLYSQIVKDYLIDIVSINAKNYGQIVSALEKIENDAKKEITNVNDLNIVLGTIIISSESIKYWKDNQNDWKKMFEDAGYVINDSELPCYVTGWEADVQTAGYVSDFIGDVNTLIWGGSAIIGGSVGQSIWNWIKD